MSKWVDDKAGCDGEYNNLAKIHSSIVKRWAVKLFNNWLKRK